MNKKILIITCMMLSLAVLSACHLGNNLVAEPMPTLEPTPVAETIVQTSEPTIAPAPVPTPELTPEPTPQPTPTPFTPTPVPGPAVLITKNPSSESLAIGGKTWFIAHAENAYSLTWELVDPDGNIHSVSDAMAQHSGLLLEVLEGDTIAVSNVPLSLNGWGVQARFDGQGNSATTSPAYIYVGDFINAYSSVIEKYRAAMLAYIQGTGSYYDFGVSEWISSCDHVGYALKDLDKNGIPELIIAGIGNYSGTTNLETNIIYELYTLSDSQPLQLVESWGRSRKYLLPDNRIYNEGSNGAASSGFILFKVNGTTLQFLEGYWSTNSTDYIGNTMYHTTSDEGNSGFGNYDKYDYTLSPQEGFSIGEQLRNTAWMPHLTMIQ